MRAHKIIWKSGGFQIVSLVLFVLIVQLIVSLTKTDPTTGLLIFWGIIFSLIPALVWLSFFYQRDRLEPEPKHYVFGVFLLGAFLAYLIGIPVVKHVFKIQAWVYLTTWGYILGSILVVGVVYQFLIYLAIRYTVYPTKEFDEWIDGVIYATAAGLGFATVLNIYRVIELGGAKLVISAIFCVINALAYASFASVIGYSLAMVKFREDYSQWRLMTGILAAAVLNGIFFWVQRAVVIRSMEYNPWNSLIAGIIIVIIVYTIVELLIRHSVALQAARTSPKTKEA
ncbi:MAG: PrsW family intramembrane metalloprotease [candidate division WOR-3 bacterium]|nr:MAG: PrsW family intramembrane metalloprotease [candidate division WOR-3 bacterium]